MRIVHTEEAVHRHRVGRILAEHTRGGMSTALLEERYDEFEFVHARHLVTELSNTAAKAREEAPSTPGWPTCDVAGTGVVGVPDMWSVEPQDVEGSEQADVVSPRDYGCCGSGKPPESPTKGEPSWLD